MSLLDEGLGPSGDIWSTGVFSFESPLKDLLDDGNYTLEQLLGEDELLQELRGMHPHLITYFSREEVVTDLIKYVSLAPAVQISESHLSQNQNETLGCTKKNDLDMRHIRYPYMACQIICCGIISICDTLVDGLETRVGSERPILDGLFDILYLTPPGILDDHRSGYLDKILSVLFRKRPKAMIRYINNNEGTGGCGLMKAMFSHLYSHSIMQILQKLLLPHASNTMLGIGNGEGLVENADDSWYNPSNEIPNVDTASESGLIRCNWSVSLEAINFLVSSLVGHGNPPKSKNEEEKWLYESQNASEALITVIQNTPLTSEIFIELTSDPILERIVTCVEKTNDFAPFGPYDSEMTCAINVLESLVLQLGGYGSIGAILDTDKHVGYDEPCKESRSTVTIGNIPKSKSRQESVASPRHLTKHLPRLLESFSHHLCHPLLNSWTASTQYSSSVPQKLLGTSRLRIIRLIESLVLLGNRDVDMVLCESQCLEICLNLFWKFRWCSMLHQSVANLVVYIFDGANSRVALQKYLLFRCNLLGHLMASFHYRTMGDKDYVGKEEQELKVELCDQSIVSCSSSSDVVIAMKSFRSEHPTLSVENEGSSVESSTGNIVGSTVNEGNVVRLSDHNLDLKDEKQKGGILNGLSSVGGRSSLEESEKLRVPSFNVINNEKQGKKEFEVDPIISVATGYMGHVIIICQALVHACTTNYDSSDVVRGVKTEGHQKDQLSTTREENIAVIQDLHKISQCDDIEDENSNSAKLWNEAPCDLVKSHPLSKKWESFVASTLASEIAIQSVPLEESDDGVEETIESLYSHRIGVLNAEVSEVSVSGISSDHSGSERGLAVGGDLIDMDDNDLDIAASMMEALSLPPQEVDQGNGIEVHQQENSPNILAENYVYDDPLISGGHSNQLGKEDRGSKEDSCLQKSDLCILDSTGERCEESDICGDAGCDDAGNDDADEAPVMDLFTGNFSCGKVSSNVGHQEKGETSEKGRWSNFANFDNAFFSKITVDTATDVQSSSENIRSDDAACCNTPPLISATAVSPRNEVEEMFGSSPHPLLLDSGEEMRGVVKRSI